MMNRVQRVAFRLASVAAISLCFSVSAIQGQTETTVSPTSAPEAAKAPEADENPFAATPAPPLPPGMTGSDANDPRFKLTPGMYDAGEASMGMKHLLLLKKPDAFQLGATDPNDPKVEKMVRQLGIGDLSK